MKAILDVDEFDEPKSKSPRSSKDGDQQIAEDVYRMRCRLVALSKMDYVKFRQFLEQNEMFFKHHMCDADKECMRRTCEDAYEKAGYFASSKDVMLFDRIFGCYIDPLRSCSIKSYGRDGRVIGNDDPYKLPIQEQLTWFADTTYDSFWKWVNDEKTQASLYSHAELEDTLRRSIEDHIRHNRVLSYNHKYKEFEESDRDVYDKILSTMRDRNEQR